MDVRSDIFPGTPDGFHPRDVSVRLARPDERIRWDRLMDQLHYLGFKRFAGRGVRYVFDWRGQWVGLAGWQSGAFKCVEKLATMPHQEAIRRLSLTHPSDCCNSFSSSNDGKANGDDLHRIDQAGPSFRLR